MLLLQEAEEGGGLLPYEGEATWHYGLFDRCCSCGADCWMAWCCSCFSLGQMAAKVRLAKCT